MDTPVATLIERCRTISGLWSHVIDRMSSEGNVAIVLHITASTVGAV